jgi:ketosteroid isomerase-like protein
VREQHVAALNAGAADAWVAKFSDDGVQMPPNAPANIGKEAIATWSQGFLSHFRVQFALDADEVRILD